MQTQYNSGRNNRPPENTVATGILDNRDYTTKKVEKRLFEVIFLNKESFYPHIDDIREEASKTILDCLFSERFWTHILGELLTNINKYSIRNKSAKLILKKEESQYKIEILNTCKPEDYIKLLKYKELSNLPITTLDKEYKDKLKKPRTNEQIEKDQAGVGLIDIIRTIKKKSKTQDDMIFSIESVDNQSGFNNKLVINIPFPKSESKTNNQGENHMDY